MSDWPDAMEWYDKVTALEADNERLRHDWAVACKELGEARADIERQRVALQEIAEDPYAVDGGAAEIARRALEPKP